MRAALIAIPLSGEGGLPVIAGKSIAHRQLLFAREVGCENVIAFGNGASTDGIDLRHAAERMGMKFSAISTGHALPGIVRDEDSLLVLQPGLLPESSTALDLLRAEGDRILVVSAGPGASAGLERIDLDRAWAGAMTVPGRLLGNLASLPEDFAPAGALLRIALQHRLPEARMADSTLDDGEWVLVTSQDVASRRTVEWQRNQLGETGLGSPSRWLARFLVTGPGSKVVDRPSAGPVALGMAFALLVGAVIAGYYEKAVLGFTLAALGAPVVETFLAISKMNVAPFGKLRRWPLVRYAVDATLLALGIMAIDSLAHRSVFPPLVLALALILLDRRPLPQWLEPARDRLAVGGSVALVAALATPELGVMLAGLVILAASIIPARR